MASVVIRLTIACVFVVDPRIVASAVSLINFLNVSICHRNRTSRLRQSVGPPLIRMNPQWSFIRRPTHWSSLPSVWRFCFYSFCSPFSSMRFVGNWRAHRPHHHRRPVHQNRPRSRSRAIDYPLPSSAHRRVVRAVPCRVPMPITGHAQLLHLPNGHWRNLTRPSSVLIPWTTTITIRITRRDRCVRVSPWKHRMNLCVFDISSFQISSRTFLIKEILYVVLYLIENKQMLNCKSDRFISSGWSFFCNAFSSRTFEERKEKKWIRCA